MFIFKLVNIKCFSTHTPYWDLNYPTQYTYLCSFQTCEDQQHLNPHPMSGPIRASTGVYHAHCRVLIRCRQSLQNHIRFSPTMKCHRKQQIKLCTRRVHDIQVKLIFCTEANYQNTLNKSKQCTRRVHEVKMKLFFCNVTKANHESLMIDSKQMYQDLGEYMIYGR